VGWAAGSELGNYRTVWLCVCFFEVWGFHIIVADSGLLSLLCCTAGLFIPDILKEGIALLIKHPLWPLKSCVASKCWGGGDLNPRRLFYDSYARIGTIIISFIIIEVFDHVFN
jgi:hypothetical protein